MKIENINCKTLISNIIENSSIDTCNFCLETIMFCTTNQRLNIKSKCRFVAAILSLPSSPTFRRNNTELKLPEQ